MPLTVRRLRRGPRRRPQARSPLQVNDYGRDVRLGLISDMHGIEPALRAVLEDGERAGVDRWWALGDLVLFGPHPVEVLLLLHSLPQVEFVSGNTRFA